MTLEQRKDSREYCVNCGEPHWLRAEDPYRKYTQPCWVEDGYDEDGEMLVATLRHRWPPEICAGRECACMRKPARLAEQDG